MTKYYNICYSAKCITSEIIISILYFIKFNIINLFSNNISQDSDNIVFFCGYGNMPGNIQWNGNSIHDGIGGSETCVINLAEELVIDNNVIIYCDCKNDIVINNVKYINTRKFNYCKRYNNLILWRISFIQYFITANNTILWIHDGSIILGLNFFNKYNLLHYFIIPSLKIVVPSKYMYDIFYNFNYRNLIQIKHGIKENKNNNNIRKPNSFVWHSVLNRGLDTLLENFHMIINEFPDSKVHIFGKINSYHAAADVYLYKLFIKYDNYIIYHNKVSNSKLLDLLNTFDIFCYPCNIIESFSLFTWEAAIHGTIPCVYDIGCLNEIEIVGGIVIKNNDIINLIKKVLTLLKDTRLKEEVRTKIMNNTINTDWKYVSKIWMDVIII